MKLLHLDDEKIESLNQLVKNVSDLELHGSDVIYRREHLLKWLVAANFDSVSAEKKLRATADWRRLNKLDDLSWKAPEVLLQCYPIGLTGFDKFGCPVWIQKSGVTDYKGLANCVSPQDFVKHTAYLLESMQRKNANDPNGTLSHQQVVILDFENFSAWQLASKAGLELQFEMVRMIETHFPEVYRRLIVVNAPSVFNVLLKLVRPFASERTLKRLTVFNSDAAQWKAALLEDIDPSQLPVHYGGTQTDPDGNPLCLTKIGTGGTVPKSFYN